MQQAGACLQQAEDVDCAGHRLNHIVETRDGAVRIRCLRQCRHDRGQHRFKRVARRFAPDRADLTAAPAGQTLHHGGWVNIAQIGQLLLKRQAFVRHARPFAAACVHHPVIDRRDLRRDWLNGGNQRVGIGQTMQPRHGIGGIAVGGYLMRLPVTVHLQAVFECPQIGVGG